MAFPRFLALRMLTGRSHLQSGQPFHMHLLNDNNLDYLLPLMDQPSDQPITHNVGILSGPLIEMSASDAPKN